MKMAVLMSGFAAVTADTCSETQADSMWAKVRSATTTVDFTVFNSRSTYKTAVKASMEPFDFPCADCVDIYLGLFYEGFGGVNAPCGLDMHSQACQDAGATAEAIMTACIYSGKSRAISAALASLTLVAAYSIL